MMHSMNFRNSKQNFCRKLCVEGGVTLVCYHVRILRGSGDGQDPDRHRSLSYYILILYQSTNILRKIVTLHPTFT
jgi:hypothetical protein